MNQQSEIVNIRYAALVVGVVMLFLGLAGFLASATSEYAAAYPQPGYSYALGLFPTNYFHNAIGILTGLWGIAAFTSLGGSISFHRAFAIVYGIQAVLGLLPFTNTFFGTMPLYGNNVWFSILLAGVTYYYGFMKSGSITQKLVSPQT
ncbi:MAG: DUF4383 domain-containing protein [Elainella sp. Prado103]|nr:DUF4383 domain-containing protein [Elainella sp. Prado103]